MKNYPECKNFKLHAQLSCGARGLNFGPSLHPFLTLCVWPVPKFNELAPLFLKPFSHHPHFCCLVCLCSKVSYITYNMVPEQSQLGDNCIQNFHFGRSILGYTVRNLVLQWRASGAVKRDFGIYIWWYTSPNKCLNMVIPILMHFCSFLSIWSNLSPMRPTSSKEMCRNWWCQTISDSNCIYCCKFLMLSNQTSHYKSKCIKILFASMKNLVWSTLDTKRRHHF